MQHVVIADENEDFCLTLAGMLRAKFDVALFFDGKSAMDHLRNNRADVLVTDLMLAEVEGLELVKIARRERLSAAIVVTGRSFSDFVFSVLEDQQVDHAVKKPCSIPALAERIGEICAGLTEEEQEADCRCAVSGVLLALGFGTKRDGFRYCRDAILLLAETPGLQMTKTVYPTVGKLWGVGGQAVEKAIRSVVAAAWEHRDEQVWRMYFPAAPNGQICRPTNTEFLTRIADAMAMGKNRAGGSKWA